MSHTELTRADAIAALKGQTLRVPDLKGLFRAWPRSRINPLHPELKDLVDRTIRQIAVTQSHVERRLRDDIALLTSLWYPDAGWHELEALGLFTVWLVCWDDEVDTNESDLAKDYERAEAWRQKTLQIARASIGLDDSEKKSEDEDQSKCEEDQGEDDDPSTDALNATLQDFEQRLVAAGYTPIQRKRYWRELSFFVDSCGTEQTLQLAEKIPSFEDYMEIRLGTVGAGILCSLVEYAHQQALPPTIAQSQHGMAMSKLVSVILSLLNDVLSLKKEMATGCVINAVTSLMMRENTLSGAVDELYKEMRQAVKNFDEAAACLCQEAQGDADAESIVKRYVDGHRAIVTGTLEFT